LVWAKAGEIGIRIWIGMVVGQLLKGLDNQNGNWFGKQWFVSPIRLV